MRRALQVSLALPVALALLWAALLPVTGNGTAVLPVKILAINDLHGGIDPGRQVGDRPVGGAAYLAAHVRARAAAAPNVLVVGAGDMVGGSPPLSALLQDEPAVRVLSSLGMVVNTPGNHEFDEGVAEFFRLSNGGCHPVTGCFEGARYRQISANIVVDATGQTLLPPVAVEQVRGVPIAFVGATHVDVPTIVAAGAVEGLSFADPAAAVNEQVRLLQQQGIHAFVVLIHDGGFVDRATGQLRGPFAATLDALDPDVDVVVSSHTHQGYVLRQAGKLVTQGFASGTAFVDIDLKVDLATRDVAEASAQVVTTYADVVEPDPTAQAIVDQAEAAVAPLIHRVVGTAAARLTREQTRAGETALGNLVADAFRWRTGARIAMTNPGGLRADLEAGDVSWGELFAVQPFGNAVVSMMLTGAQLYALYEQQWTPQADGSERFRPLQTAGLRVTWDGRRLPGGRVVALALDNGEPVDRQAGYRVAVNSFMAGGGDSLAVLRDGVDRQVGLADLEALVDYVEQSPQPFAARIEGRLTRVD